MESEKNKSDKAKLKQVWEKVFQLVKLITGDVDYKNKGTLQEQINSKKLLNSTTATEDGKFAADAVQLNKEVEGSYAAGVAEEISGINANLLQRINTIDMNSAESLQNIKKTGVYAVKSATDMPSGNSPAVMEVLNFSDTNGNYCIQRIVYIEAVDWIFQRRIHQEYGAGAWKKFIGSDTSPITLQAYNGWDLSRVTTFRNGNAVTIAGELVRSTAVTETDDNTLAFKMSVSHNASFHIIVPAICSIVDGTYLTHPWAGHGESKVRIPKCYISSQLTGRYLFQNKYKSAMERINA